MNSSVLEELKTKLEDEFSDYYEVAGGKNYRYYHLKTAHKIAKRLTEELDVESDQDVVEIAALYHDIGRSEDIEDGEMDPFEGHEGHDERGAKIISDFVSEYVTDKQMDKIEKVIRNHHSEPKTIEGKIIQDADNISNFGVNNLWRQFHYASEHKDSLDESLEYFWEKATKDYKALLRKMNFEYSRQVAEERLEKQKEVFRRVEREMDAGDV